MDTYCLGNFLFHNSYNTAEFVFQSVVQLLGAIMLEQFGKIFKVVAAGSTFYLTYKQGKKSWESGEEWGKFFILLITSVCMALSLKPMIEDGVNIMNQWR
jgi:hypothetical protein